uniref:Uncharacterized protein n=1 Tax=Rhizophagus irregularis (strain DAOM 181602 / DAOM 197198 / MUCL 43194) TaxID=747089 RepID=U9UAE7_RHIID
MGYLRYSSNNFARRINPWLISKFDINFLHDTFEQLKLLRVSCSTHTEISRISSQISSEIEQL